MWMYFAGEMKAGDMGFHNGLIIHGAGPNFTNKRRRAMTLEWCQMEVYLMQNKIINKLQLVSREEFEILKKIVQRQDETIKKLLKNKKTKKAKKS